MELFALAIIEKKTLEETKDNPEAQQFVLNMIKDSAKEDLKRQAHNSGVIKYFIKETVSESETEVEFKYTLVEDIN